ncbi:MAG: NAD-dependent epimerase/dehydratase family protein, partial [Gammaproteobacteria bacterium]|nr:NAD-dependent epimerase/dehydratase family protein [Gammaproteobacteria bacterium]
MKHKIVVFGGTGFIGSHVVEALVDAGQDVRCAVRGGSDKDFLLSLGVEIAALEAPSCSGFQTNIAEITQGCSIVYNCTADVRLNQTLDEYRKTQVEFTRVLAHAAAVQKGVRFVQLSTIEVYGETPAQAISEDYSCNPIFEFQQSVCEREQVLEEIAKETGLDYVIVRPASTFGRRYR